MNRRVSRAWMAALLLAGTLVGCKAAPAPSVGFADPALMRHDPNVPFDRFWRKPDVNWKRYDKVYLAEVNTAYMLKTTDWEKGERKADIEKDIQDLRVYTRDTIMKAFREDPSHRFQVIDSPTRDPDTLIFEVALVQVVPSKVLLNALGYAPFFVGTGVTVVRAIANDKSFAAFEMRTRDAATGDIVMLAADREAEQVAIVNLRGLTWYAEIKGIIDDWSKQLVLIASKNPGGKIKARPAFRLLPW